MAEQKYEIQKFSLEPERAVYPRWRDWFQTEIQLDADHWQKLIAVQLDYMQAARRGYAGGQLLGIPTTIAIDQQTGDIHVWPTPDREYPVRLPEPYAPRSAYAGRYAHLGYNGCWGRKISGRCDAQRACW